MRPKAQAVYDVSAPNDEYFIVRFRPDIVAECNNPNPNTQSYINMTNINNAHSRIRHYCGFQGTSLEDVKNKIMNVKHRSCQGNNVNYEYCSDVYGGDFSGVTNEQICETIRSNNPSSISNLNDFTCIKSGLPRTGYKAARARSCNSTRDLQYDKCKQIYCSDRCPRDDNSVHYDYGVTYHEVWPDPFETFMSATYDATPTASCGNYTVPELNVTSNPYSTVQTIYFEQESNATLLHCRWED